MAQGKPKRAQSTTKRARPVSPKQAPSPRGLAGPETLFGWTLLDASIQTKNPRMTAPGWPITPRHPLLPRCNPCRLPRVPVPHGSTVRLGRSVVARISSISISDGGISLFPSGLCEGSAIMANGRRLPRRWSCLAYRPWPISVIKLASMRC